MLTPELLQLLFQYNLWADRRTLDACSSLTNEQFTRDLGSSFGSVRDTLAHLAGAEFANPLWQCLHQLTNHGTYHRGQVVTLLRQLGAKPVSTDLIGLYRELAASANA